MKQTPNLNLNKPDYADIADIMKLNANADILDENINSIQTKLDTVENGAEVNVQSDWDESNSGSDAFIKNKPANATAAKSGFMSAADKKKLDGIAEGANKTVVDSSINGSSKNPVENRIIKARLDSKSDVGHKHSPDDIVYQITANLKCVYRNTSHAVDTAPDEGNTIIGWEVLNYTDFSEKVLNTALTSLEYIDFLGVLYPTESVRGKVVTETLSSAAQPKWGGPEYDILRFYIFDGCVRYIASSEYPVDNLDYYVNNTATFEVEFTPGHTHENATKTTAGFMSAADKTKLDSLDAGAKKITVDKEINSSSTNPVENKAVSAALEKKSDTSHTHKRLDNDLEIGGDYCLLVKVIKGRKGLTLTNADGTASIEISKSGKIETHGSEAFELWNSIFCHSHAVFTGNLEVGNDASGLYETNTFHNPTTFLSPLNIEDTVKTHTMEPAANCVYNLGGSGSSGYMRYKTIFAKLIDTADILLSTSAWLSPYSVYNGSNGHGGDTEITEILSDFKKYVLALNDRIKTLETKIKSLESSGSGGSSGSGSSTGSGGGKTTQPSSDTRDYNSVFSTKSDSCPFGLQNSFQKSYTSSSFKVKTGDKIELSVNYAMHCDGIEYDYTYNLYGDAYIECLSERLQVSCSVEAEQGFEESGNWDASDSKSFTVSESDNGKYLNVNVHADQPCGSNHGPLRGAVQGFSAHLMVNGTTVYSVI